MKNRLLSKSAIIKLMCCVLLIAMLSISLIGCNNASKEIDDFRVEFYESTNEYVLRDISKTGRNKDELVIPTCLNEIPVTCLRESCIKSPSLRKIFWSGNQSLMGNRLVYDCVELDTIVLTSTNFNNYKQFFTKAKCNAFSPSGPVSQKRPMKLVMLNNVKEKIPYDCYSDCCFYYDIRLPNINYYYNYAFSSEMYSIEYKRVESVLAKIKNNDEMSKKIEEAFKKLTVNEVNDLTDAWNLLSLIIYENIDDEEVLTELSIINRGYCVWIDYIEAGERIKTMPPEPTREGYKFTGWYLDEKCTQKADLNTVVKGDSDLSFYAGWKEI
ncbi:MAG: InlB B-repeat-containing protein [Clostridia bacterium]|nr:InlB B-repeat-containing protein [Clostridia bacterium]